MRTGGSAALALGILVFVARPGGREAAEFEERPEHDAEDGAGILSVAKMHKLHQKMDGNADGKVSMAEMMALWDWIQHSMAVKMAPTLHGELDADQDGHVSLHEFTRSGALDADHTAVEASRFHKADADKNGRLDHAEMAVASAPGMHDAITELDVKHVVEEVDANKDGVLTPEEFFMYGMEELNITDENTADFKVLDKDGSGTLDVQELIPWMNGEFNRKKMFGDLIRVADKDDDQHLTVEELHMARGELAHSHTSYELSFMYDSVHIEL